MRSLFKNFDWPLFSGPVLLGIIGLVALWSLSPGVFFIRQLIWLGTGLFFLFIFSAVDYRVLRDHSAVVMALFLFGIFLLGMLFVVGPVTRGVISWFRVGALAFEPAELIKILLVVVLAKYFSRRHIAIYNIRHIFISSIYMIIPTFFVAIQPDLGSAIILIVLWTAIIVFSGIRLRHLMVTGVTALIIASLAWVFLLAPYQKIRITSFFDPYRDPRGAGYNTIQSMIAVGSGGVWGKGIGYGTQSHLNFLPEAETDFIFAAFTEETGFIGGLILMLLFAFLVWRIILVGRYAGDNFSKLYALGFSALIFSQSIVHVGINLGMLPVTGITLPFVSYGGSSLVTLFIGIGILESIAVNTRQETEHAIP